jgi:ribonuclease P/MRP protein subunit RPP1
MYVDIVFPSKNEIKFINFASLLGYDGLCLVYSAKEFSQKKIDELQLQSTIKLYGAVKLTKPNKKTKTDLIITEAKDEKENRQRLEKSNINMIFNIENQSGNDFIHQRNSGLNHILCKLASKNMVSIGISFSNLMDKSFNPLLIGRISQNLRLCKKYKTKVIFASFAKTPYELRSPTDLQSFLISIGSDNQIAKEALTNLFEIIEFNKTNITKDIQIK